MGWVVGNADPRVCDAALLGVHIVVLCTAHTSMEIYTTLLDPRTRLFFILTRAWRTPLLSACKSRRGLIADDARTYYYAVFTRTTPNARENNTVGITISASACTHMHHYTLYYYYLCVCLLYERITPTIVIGTATTGRLNVTLSHGSCGFDADEKRRNIFTTHRIIRAHAYPFLFCP